LARKDEGTLDEFRFVLTDAGTADLQEKWLP
jgi:hypothetical protein